MKSYPSSYFDKQSSAAPLAVLRILFGLLMLVSLIRFWYNGWIDKIYLSPSFHFKYFGFEWVVDPGQWIYGLFVVAACAAVGVSIGYRYRLSIITFFVSFTYIEMIEKTTYLNHYYFISVLSFLMIFLPMDACASCDKIKSGSEKKTAPQWCIDTIKVMLAVVYIYAGIAKLNTDWLVNAQPLSIWLSTKTHLPIIGALLDEKWVHYAFSWGGAIYDLAIVFLLLYKPSRVFAFALVVGFHILTSILFPIGMFPYIMIAGTLIFFEPKLHEKILDLARMTFRINPSAASGLQSVGPWARRVVIIVLLLQILIPLRFVCYPGNLYWTEQGYRYSWRVMLMEKTGSATFKIVNGETGKRFYVQNNDFLNSLQEKQMATQPDFILEYAHYLGDHFAGQGHENVEVFVDSYVALNGRPSQRFIDPNVNLLEREESFRHKDWILPLDE